jgi:2,3-bisphosphoglycerate-dependent phosphoglycerate mutase
MNLPDNISRKEFERLAKSAQNSLQKPGASQNELPKTKSTVKPILIVFRHTQTIDNARRIFSGRRETQLTELGKKQAKKLGEELKKMDIDLFITSPQKRCMQTVKFVAKHFPGVPVKKEPMLVERDYGELTGTSKEKLMKEDFVKAVLYRRSYNFPPPKGESMKEVKEKRVFPFLNSLTKKIKKEKINVAVCATGNTVRFFRMYFEKLGINDTITVEIPYGDYASYKVS